MDSRGLTALLSSLISQLLLLLLLLFPSSNPNPNPNSNSNFIPLIHHFLSTSEIAATSLSLLSRKRKRSNEKVNSPIPRNPDSFKLCFKMTSSTFHWLSSLLEPLLDCRDPVGSPLNLTADTRLAIGLFRLASGSDYPDISTRFGVSEPTARFCVKQLCRVLCTNFKFWVGFPTPNELETVSSSFKTLTGLPYCCGIIHCFKFKIVTNKDKEETIGVQIVVDSSYKILNIVAGFRGDKGNLQVLKSSALYKDIETGVLLNATAIYIKDVSIPQYVVGDGGYPLLPWLLVPFVDPLPGSCEENFNAVIRLMQVSVNRAVASLRNWGVLSKLIETEFKTAVAYIGACSILHNALLMREDYSALSDELGDGSLHDQSSHYYRDSTSLGENSIEKKASEIRSALATRARDFSKTDNPMDPSTSMQF